MNAPLTGPTGPADPTVDRSSRHAPLAGAAIIRASWVSTALFVVVSVGVVVWRDAMRLPSVVAYLALAAVGLVVFVLALSAGFDRTRTSDIAIGGWFFLAGGAAPRRVRLHLLGSLAIQVIGSFVVAGIGFTDIAPDQPRKLNALAFATLVPLMGLAWCGLWGARHGTFAPRRDLPRSQPARASRSGHPNRAGAPPIGKNGSHD